MNNLHLVYAADANYLFPLRVAASSAIAQASRPQDLVIHVLDCGIPDDKWETFGNSLYGEGRTRVVRHTIDLALFRSFAEWHGSLATYARLCLPDLLPDVAWCVYADGDTLFTDDPFKLEAIFDGTCAMQGHTTSLTMQPEWFARHGLVQDWSHYVCAGFLLLNLEWMRVQAIARRSLNFFPEALMASCVRIPTRPSPTKTHSTSCVLGTWACFPMRGASSAARRLPWSALGASTMPGSCHGRCVFDGMSVIPMPHASGCGVARRCSAFPAVKARGFRAANGWPGVSSAGV